MNRLPRPGAGPPARPTQTDTRGPRDLRVCGAAVILRTLEGQAAEAALDVEAGLVDGAVVNARHTLVNVCGRPRRRSEGRAARAIPTHPRGCSGLPSGGRGGDRAILALPWLLLGAAPSASSAICSTFIFTGHLLTIGNAWNE